MGENIFVDISLVTILAVGISYIMNLLKQPLIIWYIITWLIVSLTWIVNTSSEMATLSNIGVVILLFMVGLWLNPKIIKEVGKVATITGIWQVIFTSAIGFWICRLLWFDLMTSAFISVAIAFSSTIVIMKLLSDKWDMDTLYGKISIWFLIIQDVIAMLILMFVSFSTAEWSAGTIIIQILTKWIWLVWAVILIWVYVLPKIMKKIAKSQEFLELFALGRCLVLASVFHLAWFSIEIWALIAWITLSMSPFRFEISSKMKSLRDFFIVIFFVLFGTHMTMDSVGNFILPIIILSTFVLIWNPIIVMFLMGRLGYTRKNSFKSGLTVAQISEFSFILIILWANVGYLSGDILSLISIVWLITIAWSTYFILYSDQIYKYLAPYLSIFEKKWIKKFEDIKETNHEVVLFGYDKVSFETINILEKLKKKYIIVDYNPEVTKYLEERDIDCIYWDAGNVELLDEVIKPDTKMVISSTREIESNMLILKKAKHFNKDCIVITTGTTIEDAMKMYEAGATYVILPHFIGWLHIASIIEENEFNIDLFLNHKTTHLKRIEEVKAYKIIKKEKEELTEILHLEQTTTKKLKRN